MFELFCMPLQALFLNTQIIEHSRTLISDCITHGNVGRSNP